MKKKLSWMMSLLFVLGPFFSGCGIFRPPSKDGDGYFTAHFDCCGPAAIENAINEYYRRQGVVFTRNPAPRKEISKQIQDNGMLLKKFMALFDNRVVCATWSWEIREVVKKHGFKIINVKKFKDLDPSTDIAFVLVRGKFFSRQWHWMCYPIEENITKFFGENTKIDRIYLLKRVKK